MLVFQFEGYDILFLIWALEIWGCCACTIVFDKFSFYEIILLGCSKKLLQT